jgi:hypothetical protein
MILHSYSRLKRVLNEQNMTVPELYRRLRLNGLRLNVKSLYRLSNDQQPLHRLDLRVAGAICQVFEIPLSELIVFEKPQQKLRRLSGTKQRRLDVLMAKHNEGTLGSADEQELRALVREAEEITLDNARTLAGQRRQLAAP